MWFNLYYLLLGIYLVFVIISAATEGYKMLINSGWLIWLAILLLLIGAIYYGWTYWGEITKLTSSSNSKKTPPPALQEDDISDDDEIEDPENKYMPSNDLELIENQNFRLVQSDGQQETKEQSDSYQNFKMSILDTDFIKQFTKSIIQCLQMKKKKYLKLRKEVYDQLQSATLNGNDWINSAMQKMRNEQAQSLQEYVDRIETSLEKIDDRLSTACEEETKIRLNTALYKKEVGLDTIVGRTDMKNFIADRLITFSKNPQIFFKSFQNIILMAGPGSGKTRIATTIAHVFACSGILVDDRAIITTKEGIISPFVNESAKKAHTFMLTTLEKVAFIDEAYDMTPPPNSMMGSIHRDHGFEAITQLVNDMDKMIGLHVIIAGGYEKEMKTRFLAANEGMPRRFPHQIVLEPYTSEELTSILLNNLHNTNTGLQWQSDMDNYLYTLVHQIYASNPEIFSNQAGDIINLSSDISHSIYTSKDPWPEQWQDTLRSGLNHYLSNKKVKLVPDETL